MGGRNGRDGGIGWKRGRPGGPAVSVLGLTAALLITALPGAAQSLEHAPTGEFRPPTPTEEHRQDSTRNNLVHPEGYRPGPAGTLGRVERHGSGPTPLVLVAGLGFGGSVFHPLLSELEGEYAVYLVSLAGYGGTSAPPMPPAGTSYGERTWLAGAQKGLGDFLEEEGLERPILAALYSDAANAVVHFARENPERVGGVLIMSAAARFPLQAGGPPRAQRLDAFAEQWFKTVTEVMWPSGMFTPAFYASSAGVAERAWWEVLEPTLPASIRYTVEVWADDLVPVAAGVEAPMIVLSPDFAFLEGDRLDSTVTRFHGGWDAAIQEGGALEHRVVEGGRFLLWEDAPEAVFGALGELADRRGR